MINQKWTVTPNNWHCIKCWTCSTGQTYTLTSTFGLVMGQAVSWPRNWNSICLAVLQNLHPTYKVLLLTRNLYKCRAASTDQADMFLTPP